MQFILFLEHLCEVVFPVWGLPDPSTLQILLSCPPWASDGLQILNLSSEWHHPPPHRTAGGEGGGEGKRGGLGRWISRQWSSQQSGAMAAGVEEGDSHMEDLLDQGLGMEETGHCLLLRRPSLKETYHSDSLLAPDTDFMTGRDTKRCFLI